MAFHEYPYSNFHELNLDWILQTVKQLTEDWAQVRSDWEDEQAAFADLQSYIENYFNNLDVQQEINVKLDGLVLDGTMSELIAPYVASGLPAEVASQLGDVVAAQIGAVVAAQIGAVVADQLPAIAASAAATEVGTWLSTHIDPDTGYVIDDSLTVQGAAADAKAVGDEVTAIKSALTDVDDAIGRYNVYLTVTRYDSSCYWNAESTTAVLTNYNNYRGYEPIPVTPGKKYYSRIWVATSAKQHPVLFVDENYLILSYYDTTSGDYANFEMVAPEGAVYALLTSYKEVDPPTFYYKELNNIETKWELFKDKNVVILGDSISTNGNPGSGDYPNAVEITVTADDVGIELSAYLTYYDVQAGLSLGGHTYTSEEIGTEVTFIPTSDDIGKVIGLPNNYNNNNRKTWWEVAMDAFDFNPIPVCWSGASITSHEGTDNEYKTSYAWHPAQIRKCGIRTAGTMDRTAPDVIIIYRGVNDFSHTPYARLTDGYFDGENWTYPVSDEIASGYGYKEGLCLTIKKLRDAYPNATIYLCTLNVFKRVSYANYPTRNGYYTLPQFNDSIREVADYMGCPIIEFDKDGITFENCYSGGYITDSSTKPTHPSDKGHAVMGKKAIADIKASYSPL